MKRIAASINFFIFLWISIIHFYWAFGGKLWLGSVLPSTTEGVKILAPSMLDSIIVAILLLLFSILYGIQIGNRIIKTKILRFFYWFMPIIFLIRSIGDFRYVGFFKIIQNTNFAEMDTLLFSPLCLFLSLSGFFIIYHNKK